MKCGQESWLVCLTVGGQGGCTLETVVPVLTEEVGVVRTAGYGEVMGERRNRHGSPAPPSGKGQDAQGLGVQGR